MTAAGRPQRGGLSIGAVLSQLRFDFPDVTISKIRFLESEGLVRPARTASGYRQFTPADVERLRFVLVAQRDHYLPLKVIKQQLEKADEPAPCSLLPVQDVPTAQRPTLDSPTGLTCEELLEQAGIDKAMLVELEQYGLIRPGAAGVYDQDAVVLAATVRTMTEFGIEPRHLRVFRASADREIGLLEQIVTPLYRQRNPDARGRAEEVVRELAALSSTVHALLVKAGLRDVTEPMRRPAS